MGKKINFALEYWDWLKENGYSEKDSENRELLDEFYYNVFHKKHPKYGVNGLDYFIALGKL